MSKKFLRTSDLAKAAGINVQTVRNYEALGFLPEVERSASGYRLYTSRHLYALRLAKMMTPAFGWERTRKILHAVHENTLSIAFAEIDARHAEIHRDRGQTEETLRLLRETSNALPRLLPTHSQQRTGLQISEAAKVAGVRPSALRFWEEIGLLHPQRDATSHYRLYDAEQMLRLQIVALLRKGNYQFDAIRDVLNQLSTGSLEEAFVAAEQRLQDLADISRGCIESSAALWSYIESRSSAD